MGVMHVLRTLIGLTTGLVAMGALASTASAASAPKSIPFTLFTDKDVTTVVSCPAGTPSNVVLCGYAKDVPMSASNTAGDPGLSGTITESFYSELEAPTPTADCPAPNGVMKPHTRGTLHTSKGDIYWLTAGGAFNMCTGADVEPFTILGGTGEYKDASGSGVVHAQQISATGAMETFSGTLLLGN
jgi:hypothetical protein